MNQESINIGNVIKYEFKLLNKSIPILILNGVNNLSTDDKEYIGTIVRIKREDFDVINEMKLLNNSVDYFPNITNTGYQYAFKALDVDIYFLLKSSVMPIADKLVKDLTLQVSNTPFTVEPQTISSSMLMIR